MSMLLAPYFKKSISEISDKFGNQSQKSKTSQKSQKENFKNSQKSESVGSTIYQIFSLIIFMVAMFLWFKRGMDIGGFIVACCCSPCYVAYALATPVSAIPVSAIPV
jgi:ABC-type bacteriocin/lantibiotic exporter with double-glycine peptidase domain